MASNRIFAYVSHAGGREIVVLRLDQQNGDLATVQRVGVTGKAMPLAVSPDRRFLYAALRSRPYSIASFAIDPVHGTLTHLTVGLGIASDLYKFIDSGRVSERADYSGLARWNRARVAEKCILSAAGACSCALRHPGRARAGTAG